MQPHNMERKREAFLEHLKHKYPHHASTIMGHQERLREQVRLPKHSASSHLGEGEQGEHLSKASLESLEAMSEGEPPSPFTRGTRSRASLPVVRSTNQTKDRSLGVLYLQYGEETKQMRMPNEITGTDTIRALFVSAFPQQLTMKLLESPSMAIYIKDDMRNIYYELSDIRNITSHSCLKVYHKDPAQAFNHNSKPNNGDIRVHREKLYASRDGQHSLRQPPGSPLSNLHALQGSMSPPTARSMPSSPSRIPYGPRVGAAATLPREHISSAPPTSNRSTTACPSAILERRDVKPDEDLSSSKTVALFDPYGHPEGRLSVSSAQGPADGVDGGQQQQLALYRQKSRKYAENPLATLAGKAAPSSPHRVNEVRMIDMPPQGLPIERGSPVRRSLRKDSNGPGMEVLAGVHSSMVSPVFVDLPPVHGGGRPFQTTGTSADPHTRERMKAMEQQIASLTGLVQHALLKGPNASATKESSSERPVRTASPASSIGSCGVPAAPGSKGGVTQADSMALVLHSSAKDSDMQSTLSSFKRNVSDLRLQLVQLKQMQLQNQDSMKMMLRQAEQEITYGLTEVLRHLESPLQRQRAQVDKERHLYLAMEEKVLKQLADLEKYVEKLKRDSSSSSSPRPIALRDVEEGAVNLRKVGEALAGLKGEFPALQTKMRAVLRVEVEAVRFLKEEPHKMDTMLKRVKALTETLSCLRRLSMDGALPSPEPIRAVMAEMTSSTTEGSDSSGSSRSSPTLQPRSVAATSAIRSEVTPTSPVVVQRVRSSPVPLPVCQLSAGLAHHASQTPPQPLSPTHPRGDSSPTVAKVSPCSRESSPALLKRSTLPRVVTATLPMPGDSALETASSTNGGSAIAAPSSHKPPATTTVKPSAPLRATQPEPPEERQEADEEKEEEQVQVAVQDSSDQPERAQMDVLLLKTQATMMKAIPKLEMPSHDAASAQRQADEVDGLAPTLTLTPSPTPTPEVGPKPVLEKPATVAAATEAAGAPAIGPAQPKAAVEKPLRPSVERARANSAEKATKSPPPPPPRRFYPSSTGAGSGSGMTTGRSGLVIYTSHKKDSNTASQDGGTEDEEPPQAKAVKVPPEVKPKPQSPSTPAPTPTTSTSTQDQAAVVEADEEDEGDKIMAELQHTTSPQGEDAMQTKSRSGKESIPPSSRVIYYVTGQLANERATGDTAEQKEGRERSLSQTKNPGSSSSSSSSSSSATSRPMLPSPKARQQPGSGTEKAGKSQKLQDSQRQFRQANGSSMKADGECKHAFLALPASKIPAFCPSSGKGSLSSPNSHMAKPTNPLSASSSSTSPTSPTSFSSSPTTNTSSSSSSSPSKSSIPCLSLGRHIRTSAHPHPPSRPSHPSSNDSHNHQGGKGHNLSLQQPQSQNGRPLPSPSLTQHPVSIPTASSSLNYSSSSSSYSYSSSSSVSPTSTSSSSSPSSPSLLSPTGTRGGRATHLHGIGSSRPPGGSSIPPAITPTSFSRDMS